jgi:hypothetical protein
MCGTISGLLAVQHHPDGPSQQVSLERMNEQQAQQIAQLESEVQRSRQQQGHAGGVVVQSLLQVHAQNQQLQTQVLQLQALVQQGEREKQLVLQCFGRHQGPPAGDVGQDPLQVFTETQQLHTRVQQLQACVHQLQREKQIEIERILSRAQQLLGGKQEEVECSRRDHARDLDDVVQHLNTVLADKQRLERRLAQLEAHVQEVERKNQAEVQQLQADKLRHRELAKA